MPLLFLPHGDSAGRSCSRWGCSGWGVPWWQGHDGSMGTVVPWQLQSRDGTVWHGTKRQRARSAGPNPGLGQVMGHASPMAVPDREPCQIMGQAKPRAVPGCEPCQIMSCAKPWATPGHELCQIMDRARLGAVPNCMLCLPAPAWPPVLP